MPSFVRLATEADLDRLADIERAADRAFTPLFGDVHWGEPPSGRERAAEEGFVLVVAEDVDGAPVGFVHVLEPTLGTEHLAHLEQLSVHPDHSRRGHGRKLVEAALNEASERGHETVSLRTYRDVPWNAPFYRSVGFTEAQSLDDAFHRALVETEADLGLDRWGPRVHMTIRVAALEMTAEDFEALVVDELDRLPDDMVDGLDNVVFVVEDRPEDGSLVLLGLYDGLAVTERGNYDMGELPDRIILYREPHLAQCTTEEALRDEVHATLVHEIAHYYGIDDAQLHEMGWA